jgi:hypothetical protein
MKSANDKLREDLNSLTTKVDNITKCSEPEFKTNIKHLVREEVYETNEKSRKKNNVIISGVDEIEEIAEDDARGIHGKNDKEIVEFLIHAVVGARDVEVKEVSRIPSEPTPGKARILLAKLEDSNMKFNLLRKANKLKDKKGWERTYIAPDRTKRERDEDRRLRNELQTRREAGEKTLMINKGRIVQKAPDPGGPQSNG